MKTIPKRSIVIATIFATAGFAGLMLAHAQETTTTGTTTRKNPEAISPEVASELQAVEQLPTVEPSTLPYGGRGAIYYSAQCPYWPPLPGNVFNQPVWNLGDGCYLINDLSIDYAALDTTTTAMATSAGFSPMDGGGGGFTPDGQMQSGIPYLTIAPTNSSSFLLTVWNDQGPANYAIWWTPVLANPDYPWTAVAAGITGQTNFIVPMPQFSTGFYRAEWDTNAVPSWIAADPNNPAAGPLAVYIDSPANGATIQ